MGVSISGKVISKSMGSLIEATNSIRAENPENKILLQETQDAKPIDQCTALWRAVIMQALVDATTNYKKRDYKYIKAQARSWLAGNSDDFYEVCELANYEPSYLKKMIKKVLTESDGKNNF
jgi:hypothetical protein